MVLYFIRHGQTDWNEKKLFQGNVDIPLNAAGLEQARSARAAVAELALDQAFCSPLGRARDTARIVLEGREVPLLAEERLRERRFGALEGREYGAADWGNIWSYTRDLPVEGGESMGTVCRRVGAFLDELRERCPGQRILLVSHGGIYQAVLVYADLLRGLSGERTYTRLENAEIAEFHFDADGER